VLHHLPEHESAFRNLFRFLKTGGEVQIYLYCKPECQPIKSLLLRVWMPHGRSQTRLPHSEVYVLAYLAAIAAFMFFVLPYRVMKQVSPLKGLAEDLPMMPYASFRFVSA